MRTAIRCTCPCLGFAIFIKWTDGQLNVMCYYSNCVRDVICFCNVCNINIYRHTRMFTIRLPFYALDLWKHLMCNLVMVSKFSRKINKTHRFHLYQWYMHSITRTSHSMYLYSIHRASTLEHTKRDREREGAALIFIESIWCVQNVIQVAEARAYCPHTLTCTRSVYV